MTAVLPLVLPLTAPVVLGGYSPWLSGQGGRVPSIYIGQVATKTWVPIATSAGNKQFMSRSPHIARDNIQRLQIVLPNWYWDRAAAKDEKGSGGNTTYTASIEYPVGVFTQIKFSGLAAGVAASGNNLVSDWCDVSIPNGAWFFVRVWCNAIAGIVFHGGFTAGALGVSICDTANGQRLTYGASGVVDQTMGGTVVDTGTGNKPCFTPLAIIAETRKPSIFLMGDSINYGTGDTFDETGDLGILARAIGPALPYINAGCHGDTAQTARSNYAKRSALIQYCSHVVCELGFNDLSASAGNRTAAQLQADLAVMYAFAGGKPISQTTITPRSTSTDNWATPGLQTIDANNAQKTLFNTWVRSKPTPLAGYFDLGDVLATSRDSDKWKTTGSAYGYTQDGVHPNRAGNLLVKNAGAINPALFARA